MNNQWKISFTYLGKLQIYEFTEQLPAPFVDAMEAMYDDFKVTRILEEGEQG